MPECLNGNNNNPCTSCFSPDDLPIKWRTSLARRVRVYNAEFRAYLDGKFWVNLPGNYLVSTQCNPQCRTIETNVIQVARFIQNKLHYSLIEEQYFQYVFFKTVNTILKRFGKTEIRDLKSLLYQSSINIIGRNNHDRTYCNALWLPKEKQCLFGQRYIDNSDQILISYGTDLTIVAHEFCHGLIQQIKLKNGRDNKYPNRRNRQRSIDVDALEESFCDIFAILVRNFQPDQNTWLDIGSWQWCVGEDFRAVGQPLRCLDTMTCMGSAISLNTTHYHELSLFHSHAFHEFMTTPDGYGGYLFDGEFALQLFGATLESLPVDANFLQSRETFVNSAKILLKSDSLMDRELKLQAINKAFDNLEKTLNLSRLN